MSHEADRIGCVEGKCSRCGQTLIRKHPATVAVCDCYKYCPLCDPPYQVKMTPYTPDLTPITYEPEKGLEVFYVCNNHTPPYYSKQKPVEVKLS